LAGWRKNFDKLRVAGAVPPNGPCYSAFSLSSYARTVKNGKRIKSNHKTTKIKLFTQEIGAVKLSDFIINHHEGHEEHKTFFSLSSRSSW
jgi:hypothetical protein